MPTSEKGRRAAFAELARRKKGGANNLYKGMKDKELESYAKAPLHKGKGKGKGGKKGNPFTAEDQASALRG